MQSYGTAPARNSTMNPSVPVPAGKTGPVGGCGSDKPVSPSGTKADRGFTGSIKPGKI